jgi:STE24 endopeptidase
MWVFAGLLLAQFAISTALSLANLAHLRQAAAHPPQAWVNRLNVSRFPTMIAYTAAQTRLGAMTHLANLVVTLAILLSGFFPALTRSVLALDSAPLTLVSRLWSGLIVLAAPVAISYAANIPWDLISDFGVEKRFGFSTVTFKTWLTDQVKSLLIALVLGIVLGGGLLLLIDVLGYWWWLPAWALFTLFQMLMTLIAPTVLLPLFNRFEPLRDDDLRRDINDLAGKASFPLAGVFQMDASQRTTHSNAFFIGFGRTRRIVLFDTLLEHLSHEQILAVLAHEIGHWKKRHVIVGLATSTLAAGAGMALVALLLDTPWLYQVVDVGSLYAGLGTVGPVAAVGLYLIGILLSPLGLLLAPLMNWISRRRESQADAYAVDLYAHPGALEEALIQLSEKNLSNLFPHPLVVLFRYSHPPLIERVKAIRAKEYSKSAET